MDIIWHGHSCFELVSGGYSAVIDPFQDTSVGTAYPHVRLTADAVYISHEDRDHNFREGVTLRNTGKANPFAVTELETYHDIMRGRLRGMNTVRIFAAEGMRVAHLGDLGAKPTPEQMQQLQGLDAMMIPVGGIYTIEPGTAYYLCEQLQPRVIIPIFRSWVRREARVKRTGSGIVTMMRTEAPLNRGEFYYEVDAFHGYAAGVAAGQPEPPQPVHRLMLDQLL